MWLALFLPESTGQEYEHRIRDLGQLLRKKEVGIALLIKLLPARTLG